MHSPTDRERIHEILADAGRATRRASRTLRRAHRALQRASRETLRSLNGDVSSRDLASMLWLLEMTAEALLGPYADQRRPGDSLNNKKED